MNDLKAAATAHMKAIGPLHVPKNARRYNWAIHTGEPLTNAFGMPCDPPVTEGTVIDATAPWVVVKTKPTHFVVYHDAMFRESLVPGSKVKIEAYARRHFDGRRLDAPVEETTESGFKVHCFILGDTRSPIPVPPPQCPYLKDMIQQMEVMRAPDGLRTVAQILVDAKARDFATIDPSEDDDIIAKPPTLSFVVSTERYQGLVTILYRRVPDYYEVQAGGQVFEDVDFESLGSTLADLVDDGEWRFAKVEVLKPAKGKR